MVFLNKYLLSSADLKVGSRPPDRTALLKTNYSPALKKWGYIGFVLAPL